VLSAVQFVGRFGPLTVITYVITASSIPASGGGGYARYLESKTVAPERGDYYLTPDGEMAQAPGRWLSDPETLGRLGVQLGEPVDGADFIALMEGRHPSTGQPLGRRRSTRRAHNAALRRRDTRGRRRQGCKLRAPGRDSDPAVSAVLP
jgi:hypothetical protein